MSASEEAKERENEEDLSKLLDNALEDFGKKASKSDDDLDDFMASMDREAAQKAAKNFQVMLEKMAEASANESSVEEGTGPTTSSFAQANFMETINKLVMDFYLIQGLVQYILIFRLTQQTGDVFNAADDESFRKALENMNGKDEGVDDFMGLMVETALSKELMYPAIKEITDNFQTYLQENEAKLDKKQYDEYVQQHRILIELRGEYEKPDGEEKREEKAARIAQQWVELQKHGIPPMEVTGASMPGGWMNEGVNDISPDALKETCSLM